MSEIPLGRFVWYQLNSTDPEAARRFYVDLIGWDVSVWEREGDEPYTMFKRGEEMIGGIMRMPEQAAASGAPQHWLAYISTPDVDKSVTQAAGHGAQIFVPPGDLPEVGRFAVLADPQGATFSLYAPQQPPEDTPFEPGIGDVSWHELATTDAKAASDFYCGLLGWEETEVMDMGEMGLYHIFGRGGKTLGGMFDKPADMPAPPHWLLYMQVDDVHGKVEQVKKMGGQILNGPMEVPGGDLIVQCMDPQGAAFALHSVKG